MKLSQLMATIEYTNSVKNVDVTGIASDTRKLEKGFAFVCIKGGKIDGHDLVTEEIASLCSVVVCERDLKLKNQVIVKNTREALAVMSANFYGNAMRRLKLIGVSGTNGKTTITCMIKQVLESMGKTCGLIGTIRYEMGDYSLPAKYTTPDPIELHQLFYKMEKLGCEYVVMEASSQALHQLRLFGVNFSAAVFTNLTQDHLDYHGDMENYYLSKRMLFENADVSIVNIDDRYGERLKNELSLMGKKVKTYSSYNDNADYVGKNIKSSPTGASFEFVSIGNIGRINLKTPGVFSVLNALGAGACLMEMGLPFQNISKGLNESCGVKGRGEVIPTGQNFSVMCDYAHTPDSLEKILSTVKEFAVGRVVALFGAAGMRDAKKRPIMGKKAAENSDFLIITSDNPRDEDPDLIISQVVEGIKETGVPYKVIPDRYEAIFYAIENAKENDLIVLCGKGHEDYQILNGMSVYFDERDVVRKALDKFYGKKD